MWEALTIIIIMLMFRAGKKSAIRYSEKMEKEEALREKELKDREEKERRAREEHERNAEARRREEERRRKSPCYYSDGITEEDFENIVKKAGKNIKRLIDTEIKGLIIYGTVRSQSGISKWGFEVDFNDYGHITGKYWLRAENYESDLPNRFAENIKDLIMEKLDQQDCSKEDIYPGREDTVEHGEERKCSLCGEVLNGQPGFCDWNVAFTCKKCGHYNEWAQEEWIGNKEKNREQPYTYCTIDDGKGKIFSDELAEIDNKDSDSKRHQMVLANTMIILLTIAVLGLTILAVYFVDSKINGKSIGYDNATRRDIKYEVVKKKLKDEGFLFVSTDPIADLDYSQIYKKNSVDSVYVNDSDNYEVTDKFSRFVRIVIKYHTMKRASVPVSAKEAVDQDYLEVARQFEDAGFGNIVVEPEYDIIFGIFDKVGTVKKIVIDGESFDEKSIFAVDSQIRIIYHEKSNAKLSSSSQ